MDTRHRHLRGDLRLVRVLYDGDCRYGLADDDTITLISDEPFASWEPEGLLSVAEANFLAPVPPTKVVCVGLNYKGHIAEMGHEMPDEPVIFIKPSTAVIGPGQTIPLPPGIGRVDYEAELGVVIGRRTHNVTAEEAAANVLGLVLRQRRHRARPPAGRRTVDACEGVRRILSARPVGRHRGRSR